MELRINFSTKNTTALDPVVVNGMPIELGATANILGLNVSCDLKWNFPIDSIIKKAQSACIVYLSLNALAYL